MIFGPPPFWNSTPPAASKSFIQNNAFSGSSTTYTATDVNFGAADARRHIIVGVATSGGDDLGASSVTVGGVSASSATALSTNGSGGRQNVQLWVAAVPSGASGDIVVSFSGGSKNRCGMTIWRAELTSSTPIDTGIDGTGGGNSAATTCSVTAGSITIGITAEHNTSSGNSVGWTGLTLDDTTNMGSTAYVSAASEAFASAESERAMSVLWDASVGCALAVASFH